ncbi:hypothetical protein Dhaf_4460 [Desulfitobacterium hafniense DCB-2]|uniref:Uncharacterized protein n=1 Tax=Desulfitobacterium hafniense (strain DSM 10664 / DCB-2) TaxID=272564 RepID=B8FVR2_DESHD|nr:hypothetical protein [Desulfitobacterium hafniense]ACL22464.1 hypothetical protein Dhaf_4460 [Desulfitobacterium hafniense DCB-2]
MPTFKISEDTRRELERFKEYMRKQEYSDASVSGYGTYLSRFLRQTELLQADTSKEAFEVFLETEKVNNSRTFKYCRAALSLYYMMVSGNRLKSSTETTSTPELAGQLQHFREYSLQIKHIKEDTANSEVNHVRRFLQHAFIHNPQGFAKGLTAEDIRKYAVERLATLSLEFDTSKTETIEFQGFERFIFGRATTINYLW